ncbi:YegP family protein [Microbacterium sp. GXF0217]
MAGKFELYQDKGGDYRFRLKSGNGEVIATGQGYSSKSGALNGIDSVRRNAADAEVVEVDG